MDELQILLKVQDGIVSRRQAIGAGMSRAALEWTLQRGDWVTIHPGVYAAQTGPLSWQQRAWAAVLLYWPAALSHQSAIDLSSDSIHVAVEAEMVASRLVRCPAAGHR